MIYLQGFHHEACFSGLLSNQKNESGDRTVLAEEAIHTCCLEEIPVCVEEFGLEGGGESPFDISVMVELFNL